MLAADVQEGLQGSPIQVNPMRFRPNLVISGGTPYAEDQWRSFKIGNKSFVVSPNLLRLPKLSQEKKKPNLRYFFALAIICTL